MAKKENKVETKQEEIPLTKKELRAKKRMEVKKKHDEKSHNFWKDFKKFISRGNVMDMSIGVVIGTAFGAIVTALTNIFLSICTWAVPGGLKGLITILPPMTAEQAGIQGAAQYFYSNSLNDIITKVAAAMQISRDAARTEIMSKYTLHGSIYVFNGAAVIDWGAFINAAFSFFIIAMILFIIVRVFTKLNKARQAAYERALEEYYKKHPEARPAPVPVNAPEPTDHQILKEILATLKTNQQPQTKQIKTKKEKT